MTVMGRDGCVEFRFFRPAAHEVRLAGEFTGWHQPMAMQREPNGWWVAKIELEPGEYRFRYIADGVWYTDFASNGIEGTKFGYNSVLVVRDTGKRRAKIRPIAA